MMSSAQKLLKMFEDPTFKITKDMLDKLGPDSKPGVYLSANSDWRVCACCNAMVVPWMVRGVTGNCIVFV